MGTGRSARSDPRSPWNTGGAPRPPSPPVSYSAPPTALRSSTAMRRAIQWRTASTGSMAAAASPQRSTPARSEPSLHWRGRCSLLRSVLSLYADAAKLEALGRHAQDYINLFATIKHAEEAPQPTSGDENRFELALRAAVTMESVMHLGGAGGLKRRGTVIWRNQAGPNETCQRSGGAKASGADGSADQAADFMTLCDPDCLAPYTNVFVLGMPASHSLPFIERFAEQFEALGVVASVAPNSVCIKNSAVDKSRPIAWLRGGSEADNVYCFSPSSSGMPMHVAFGDNPPGNDAPLASWDQATGGDGSIPLVSVAAEGVDVPAAVRGLHVGAEELGCAAVIEEMRTAQATPAQHAAPGALLQGARGRLRKTAAVKTAEEACYLHDVDLWPQYSI